MHGLDDNQTLRAAVQAAPVAVVALSRDARVLLWNPAAERIFGWRAEEVVGGPFPVIPPDRAHEYEAHVQALERGVQIATETVRRRKDGTLIEVALSAAAILDDAGHAVGWMAVYQDLTSQRRTERDLASRSSELKAIMQAFPDLYFWLGPDGRIHDWHAGHGVSLARPPEAFLGRFGAEVFPGLGERFDATARLTAETGTLQSLEYTLETPKGLQHFEARYVPLPDGRVLCMIRNITGRRQAEEEVQRSLELLRTVIEGTPDPIFMKDTEGRYRLANHAMAAVVGRTADEVLGATDHALFPAEQATTLVQEDRRVLESGLTLTFETEVWTEGRPHYLLTTKSPLNNPDGTRSGLVGVSHDITELRHLEAQFRQAQKMEAVGRLAGGVAHDFNNLLTVIVASSDLLMARLAPSDPLRAEVEQITDAAQRAAELTRQLLAFSRRRVTQPQRIEVGRLVAKAAKMLRRLVGEHIRMEMQLGAGCDVFADAGQLEQVLVNLVVNARDAMPDGGRLRVSTERIEAGADGEAQGALLQLEVSDTGLGMDEETRAHIFEPFFTTKGPGEGTGLGLSTVYGIVEQLGGTVTVESAPGRGSTFRVRLPCVDPEPAQAEAPAPRPAPGGQETVLVVEDEPAVRRLARRALGAAGYTVLDAGSGDEALRLAESYAGAIDLVLTDVVMPGMNGRELVELLQHRRPRCRALFMSGFASDTALHRRLAEQRATLLEKPFSVDGLIRAVREVLDA